MTDGDKPGDLTPELSLLEIFRTALWAAGLSCLLLVSLGLARRAYSALRVPGAQLPPGAWLPSHDWLQTVVLLAVSGGVSVGILVFTWRLVHRKRWAPSWGMAMFLLVIVLFALLIWPTPWTYREYGCKVFQINRILGTRSEVVGLPGCEDKETGEPKRLK